MTKYTIDHVNEEIIVIKSFAKAAGIVGSPDYKEMLALQHEMPEYKIVVRAISRNTKKQTYGKLTLERMEAHIIAKEGKDSETLTAYKRELELAKIHRSPYNHMKKWFLERYKEDFTAADTTTAAE